MIVTVSSQPQPFAAASSGVGCAAGGDSVQAVHDLAGGALARDLDVDASGGSDEIFSANGSPGATLCGQA